MKKSTWVMRSEIHGVRVDVEVDDREVHGWFEEYLSAFATAAHSPPKIKFSFRICPDNLMTVPEEARWFMHYYGLAGLTMDRYFYFRAMGSVMRFDPAESEVFATITPQMLENRRYLTHLFFSVAFFETLRYHGLYYIHGAALVSPAQEGLLIPANGSSGKSTLSVALLHYGYNYLSDDAVFARMREGGVELVPFIREFHAPPRLAEVFEELKFLKGEPEYFPGDEKRALRAEEVYPGRLLKVMRSPEVILFPEIVRDDKSSVLPVKSQEALSRLIPNSPLVMFSLSVAKPHLEVLNKMVRCGRCFVLRSGRDVLEDPAGAVEAILTQLGLSGSRSGVTS